MGIRNNKLINSESDLEKASVGNWIKVRTPVLSNFSWMIYEGVVDGMDSFLTPLLGGEILESHYSERKYLQFMGEGSINGHNTGSILMSPLNSYSKRFSPGDKRYAEKVALAIKAGADFDVEWKLPSDSTGS